MENTVIKKKGRGGEKNKRKITPLLTQSERRDDSDDSDTIREKKVRRMGNKERNIAPLLVQRATDSGGGRRGRHEANHSEQRDRSRT